MSTPQRERRHLAAGVAASMGGQVAGIAAAAIAGVAIARMLGPVGTGTFALVLNLFGLITLLVGLGLRQGLTYMVSHGRWAVPDAVRTSQLVSFGLGLTGAAIGFGLYELTSGSLLEGLTTPMALAVLAATPFGLSWLASSGIAIAREHYEAYGIFQFLPYAGILVFSVSLAAVLDVGGAVAGFAIAQGVAALIAGAWVWRLAQKERAAVPEAPPTANGDGPARPLRETFNFGLKSWGSDILQFLNYRVDLFILNAYAAAADVGIYSVAVAIATLGLLLPGAFNTVLLPRTADLDAAVKKGEIPASESDASAARAVRHGVLLMLPTAAVLAILMLLVPFLYGDRFSDSVALGMILIPGIAARGLARVVNPITSGRGYVRYPLYVGLMTAPPTIGLYLLLIPPLDATGAALASTASYLMTSLLSIGYFRRATKIRLRDALIPSRDDVRDYRFALGQAREYLRSARARFRTATPRG